MEKILYVDDRDDLKHDLKEQLSEFEFIFSSSSLEARDLIQRNNFSIVIADVLMPFIDGLELCQIARQKQPDLPFLFITEDRTLSLIEECLTIPNSYTLSKVSPYEHYRASINKLTQSKQSCFYFGISSVSINEKKYSLTPLETRILQSLIDKNFSCTKAQLKLMAWEEEIVTDRTLNTHVSNLRQKIRESDWSITIQRDGIVKLYKKLL